MPKISIITALHNKGLYVGETIRSVLAQTMSDWEMIVVENGSTDNGPDVVRQFSDARIRLVVSPKCGPGAARNFGLNLSSGEWILFLDADDLLQPEQLSAFLSEADANEGADLVIGRARKFTDSPLNLAPPEIPACEGRTHAQLLDSAIAFAPWAVHTALIKHASLTPELHWPEHLDCFLGEDIAFWFKLLNRMPHWVRSDSSGCLYRWKTPGCRTKNENADAWFAGLHNAVEENLHFLKQERLEPTAGQSESIMRLYEGLYRLGIRSGNRTVARESARLTRHWLKNSFELSGWRRPLLLRRLIGLRVYTFLQKCALSQG